MSTLGVYIMDLLLETTARAERDHFWFRGFRRFVEPMVARAVANLPDAAILDCGCGTGHNLSLLRRHGRAFGIDLTLSGLRLAQSRGEQAVARASITALPFSSGSFDVVTSFDVLYALEDDDERSAFSEVSRVVRTGGHVLLNVAALDLLKGNHSVWAQEVRRYTRATLRAKLERNGLDVVRLTYTYATIFPLVAAVRLLQRAAGHKESQREITVPPAPVNAVLSAVLAVEAAVLRVVDMPFGSSLLALARKR